MHLSIMGFPDVCLVREIGENILEAKSCQHSAGLMFRVHRQMAYTNPDIMERWCFSSGFVLASIAFYYEWVHN